MWLSYRGRGSSVVRGRTDVVGVSATAKCSTRATPAHCSLQRPVANPVKCSISFYRCLHVSISDGRSLNLTGKSKVLTNGFVSSDAGQVGSNRCRRLTSVKEHSFRYIQKGNTSSSSRFNKSKVYRSILSRYAFSSSSAGAPVIGSVTVVEHP